MKNTRRFISPAKKWNWNFTLLLNPKIPKNKKNPDCSTSSQIASASVMPRNDGKSAELDEECSETTVAP